MNLSSIFRYLFFILSIIFFLVNYSPIYAHETGPSYVMVNGESTVLNIVHAFAHNPGFTLATDLTPQNAYRPGTPIHFSINKENYFTPENAPSEFKWNFQDGTEPVTGDQVTHSFSSAGSYFVQIEARIRGQLHYSLADIVQINIVPSDHYVLPTAKITVDGKLITDFHSKNQIEAKKPIEFDGSESVGKNLRYYWELGDGTRSRDKNISHTYRSMGESTYFIVLRVSDDQNIVHDSIITLSSTTISKEEEPSNYFMGLFRYFSDVIARVIFRQNTKN